MTLSPHQLRRKRHSPPCGTMMSYNWGINGRPLVHAGATVTVDELRAYLKARVARYEMPRDLVVVDHIPRNPTGKLQRAELPVAPDPRRVGGG